MSDSPKHTAVKATVDAAPAGGDDHKSARRGAIFIGFALLAFVVYLVVSGQVAEFWRAMQSVQVPWLVVACFCMLLYLIFGIAAYAIAVWLDPESPVGIRDLISVEASGIFFGNLTPMQMGSTPAQIYRLTKAGQNVGEAGATQFTRFIVYQFGLVVWCAILLIARMPFFTEQYGDITLISVFSFGGHVLILLAIFAIALMPRMVIRVAHWLISLLARVGVATDKVEHLVLAEDLSQADLDALVRVATILETRPHPTSSHELLCELAHSMESESLSFALLHYLDHASMYEQQVIGYAEA